MSSTTTQFAALLSNQINSVVDKMTELRTEYLLGIKSSSVFKFENQGDYYPSDVQYFESSTMSIGEFTYKFEELSNVLETLRVQQAEW